MRLTRNLLPVLLLGVSVSAMGAPQEGVESSGAFMIAFRGSAAAALIPAAGNLSAPLPGMEILVRRAPAADPAALTAPGSEERVWVAVETRGAGFAAAPQKFGDAWDTAHRMIENPAEIFATAGVPESQFTDPANIYMIEPDVSAWDPEYARRAEQHSASAPAGLVAAAGDSVIVAPDAAPSRAWPAPPHFAWHLGSGYSHLKAARDAAAKSFDSEHAERNVLVYHLDTGYSGTADLLRPRGLDPIRSISFLDDEGWRPNTADKDQPRGFDRLRKGTLANPGHGTATLSVLAGNYADVRAAGFHDFIGGAPLARVASCRISQSVIHLNTKVMTRAINGAVANGANVITMAAGGPPSQALCDAVNDAYDNGTAMVFAASDFFEVPLLGIEVPPHTSVYPARFNRALAVTGITAAGRPYGLAPFWGWLRDAKSWALRGSYGPRAVLEHSLAAYTPNVVAQSAAMPNVLRQDFAGTSAATPQVAAAAALWIQVHRDELASLPPWMKAEAVYQALYAGASMPHPASAPHAYFGRGVLDAEHTLSIPVRDLKLTVRPESTIGFDWIRVAGSLIDATSAQQRRMEAHRRMIRVEVAQLVASSTSLRRILQQWEETGAAAPDPATYARFVRQLKRDPRASEFLKKNLM